MSLTKAVASVNKLAGNVYVQLSLAKRNDTIGSVGVGLRYAMEQQAVATVTTNEVANVIKGLKRGKAFGPDNVAAEGVKL